MVVKLKHYILIITGVVLIVLSAPYVYMGMTATRSSILWDNLTMLAVGIGILTWGLLSLLSRK